MTNQNTKQATLNLDFGAGGDCRAMTCSKMAPFRWNSDTEKLAQKLRAIGKTYQEVANKLGTTATSVKHKIRRINQSSNMDKYKHTKEKLAQLESVKHCVKQDSISILETHGGFGGMSEHYQKLGHVESYDIDGARVDAVNRLGYEDIQAIKGDSEKEIYRLVGHGCKYDIVDIDPYGFPSRYFPHAFSLIKDGLLFLTFPTMGVAQINKITIRHYQAFWGIDLADKGQYVEKVKSKLTDFAFQHKRAIEFLDVQKIDRIYRFAIRVKEESLCSIVGLEVKRGEKSES